MAKKNDITFNMVNEAAIKRLKRDGKVVLPQKKIDVPKDMRWNMKTFNSKLLQGLENGDSVQKIAKSILPEIMSKTDFTGKTQKQIYGKGGIIDKNRQSAIRNARTMVTSAENHGRLDSMKDLAKQGVVIKKEWEATPDDRTRPSHIDIDGEEQDLDKPFSNGCQFPGDGRGPAEEVWMCRCAIGSHIIGFKRDDGSISKVNYQRDKTTHDVQMKSTRKKRVTRPLKSSNGLSMLNDNIVRSKDNIPITPVRELKNALSEDDIIRKIRGNDTTEGSCVSLTYSYIANKLGLDVEDFKGGDSCNYFKYNWKEVCRSAGVNVNKSKYILKKETRDASRAIMSNVQQGKEYVLAVGEHMTIIKREGDYFSYLELQSLNKKEWEYLGLRLTKTNNRGTFFVTDSMEQKLFDRFSCRKTVPGEMYLIDIDEFKATDKFKNIMGYINTKE